MIENKKSEVTNNKIELTNEDKIMYGKPLADKITQGVTERVQNLKSKGIQVKLAILKVGNRPGDEAYQRGLRQGLKSVELRLKL